MQSLSDRRLMKVMLAEDSDDDLLLATEATREGGLAELVFVAGNGQSAIQFLEECGDQVPDLLLLDVNLPIRNGFEILAKARERHAPEALPVIMISSSSRTPDICTAYRLGASAYLYKPSDYADLKLTLNSMYAYFARLQGSVPHSALPSGAG